MSMASHSHAVAKRESAEMAAPDPQLDAIKRVLSQQTPSSEIRVRVGRGGMQLKYTDGAYVIRTLNAAFGWDWDFVADCEELLLNNGQPFEVKCRGTLTVRLSGRTVIKTQYGSQPIEMLKNGSAPVSIGDCYKGAATDAMKKCASLLGIALDLYDSDYRADKYADDSEEPQPARKPDTRDVPRVVPHVEPEPVRTVRLEGAQPTGDKAQWPKAPGIVGQIFAKCQALGWTAANLADEIEKRFKMVIPEESIIVGLADSLELSECKTLDQALAAEFQNRSRTR